jgi:hypothetical protein
MYRSRARDLYRQLLRIQQERFKGDDEMIKAAHDYTKREFMKMQNETDTEKIEAALKHGQDVLMIIERNVAQVSRVEGKPGVYHLNLTDKHEINPNPPVKISSLKKKST